MEVARLLLDSGAQVNMPADSFESPLTLAACGGHVELAALLIERGANLEEVCKETGHLNTSHGSHGSWRLCEFEKNKSRPWKHLEIVQ